MMSELLCVVEGCIVLIILLRVAANAMYGEILVYWGNRVRCRYALCNFSMGGR